MGRARLLVLAATLLALVVIGVGAYVRLSDAGLGCPDWPGCYGQLVGVPEAAHEQSRALIAYPDRPIETHKAWKEVIHRYLAATLGLLIGAIAIAAWRQRGSAERSSRLVLALLVVLFVQALLGMWTVTELLRPAIVTAHLAGGMTTLALLVGLLLTQRSPPMADVAAPVHLKPRAAVALIAVALQIVLGGWVSSNYAAFACGTDFPACLGHLGPETDFAGAFALFRELGKTSHGAEISLAALATIHWVHRLGALVVAGTVGALAIGLLRCSGWRSWGWTLTASLAVQIVLGIANVIWLLPLPTAVLHNLGAAVLLSLTVAINVRLSAASTCERGQQLAVDAAETAVAHDQDMVAGSRR